jgi:pimeloyl-ACP methyl ester carboxylesterase
MKLRTILAGAAGAAGVTTLANRVLAARASGFDPFLAGDHQTYRWNGFDVAYTEAGDPEDPDLLLLHGINAAAANHEWDPIFQRLAADHHVLAPDLPGFGHSDRPPLLYSASTYEAFVGDAIADLTDGAPVVVASSLSGAYAAVAAETEPVAELVLVSPTTDTMGSRSVPLRTLLRTPLVGQGLFNCIASKPAIRYFQADHGYFDVENYDEAVLRYEWLTAHQPGARFAPASFVTGFLDPDVDLGATLAGVDAPVSLAWGRDADITPLERGRELAERADASLVVFDEARLLPHVEHPDSFAALVRSGPEAIEENAD